MEVDPRRIRLGTLHQLSDFKKATKKERPKDGLLYLSATSLSDLPPDDFPTRVRSAVTDELHCYNNASNNFGHQVSVF